MRSKAELRREIEKVSSEYTPHDLFSSPCFPEMLQATITAVCEGLGRLPDIKTICEEANDFTACTDGMKIIQNTQGPLIKDFPTNWQQYVANIGHTVHECGHVLFTDFINQNPLIEGWMMGRNISFHPEKPSIKNADEVEELLNKLPFTRAVYCSAMRSIVNTLEDAYVENRLRDNFDGLAVAGLEMVNQELYRKAPTINESLQHVLNGEMPPLQIADSIFLSRYVCGEEFNKQNGELTQEQKELLDFINDVVQSCKPITDRLMDEQDGRKRCELFNRLFIKLFVLMPIIQVPPQPPTPPQKGDSGEEGKGENQSGNQSGQSGGKSSSGNEQKWEKGEQSSSSEGSEDSKPENGESQGNTEGTQQQGNESQGNSQGSSQSGTPQQNSGETGGASNPQSEPSIMDLPSELARQLLEQLANSEKESGKSQQPEGNTSSIKQGDKPSKEERDEKRQQAKDLANSSESMQRELQQALKDAAKMEVIESDERQHCKELEREAKLLQSELTRINGGCDFRGYSVSRKKGNKELYHSIYRDVQHTSKNLTRKIKNILKEREADSVESGFLMGQKFEARSVVNRDGKYFSRQIVPDGKAEVCFGIVIDESGSMSWNDKCVRARRTAILIEDTLRNLGIPLMIVGHSESGSRCDLNCYADFDTFDGQDCYRLSDIHASGGNIDGAAISYVGEKLLKRPEKIKVMIVISDGLPAGRSFYANDNNEDTKKAAEHYRKKNVRVFGAVIDQYEQVSDIYGPEYSFDCRADAALEKELIKLIKKYVLLQG